MIIKTAIILQAEPGENIGQMAEQFPGLFNNMSLFLTSDIYLKHNSRVINVNPSDTPASIVQKWARYEHVNAPEGAPE